MSSDVACGLKLVVVGCGPKAIAILAKARALQEAGLCIPQIVIIDRHGETAANWSGRWGFTDGLQALGTSPGKDVGFPYKSALHIAEAANVDQNMFRWSWPSYKIAAGKYAEWVDRRQPPPRHQDWAAYLTWVGDQIGLKECLRVGNVTAVTRSEGRWIVRFVNEEVTNEEVCNGVVFTGPGPAKRIRNQANHGFIYDGQTFWEARNQAFIKDTVHMRATRVAVIGAGETAASVTSALLSVPMQGNLTIDMISRRGTLYSRGEGYHENRYFSDPSTWQELPISHREELIERTDRGVLSLSAIDQITRASNVNFIHGEVERISAPGQQAQISLRSSDDTTVTSSKFLPDYYDFVVVALGFDLLDFVNCFELQEFTPALLKVEEMHAARVEGTRSAKLAAAFAEAIDEDLSVRGLEPKLHLPMLSGLRQGPGFPNLSCLGLLSDRILHSYITRLNAAMIPQQV